MMEHRVEQIRFEVLNEAMNNTFNELLAAKAYGRIPKENDAEYEKLLSELRNFRDSAFEEEETDPIRLDLLQEKVLDYRERVRSILKEKTKEEAI